MNLMVIIGDYIVYVNQICEKRGIGGERENHFEF